MAPWPNPEGHAKRSDPFILAQYHPTPGDTKRTKFPSRHLLVRGVGVAYGGRTRNQRFHKPLLYH